ncbi:hypothetical protein [Nonomuraea pusilla]|uniref:Integral membrane protein n=1 Tax=Nonomuraea pusilla TaxID=46177 RepID=A0A1H7TIU8_9ACTN|nr:hypothetical protein [Nonomuraea pusilla]SEL84419.1 hypothetical protein SAMN05660976_03512 [Nonomuraea pusilla]
MDGFLDTSRGGVTELRVHGVSGTPPAAMLNHPSPRLVVGDGVTGFYRRWWPGGRPAGEHADVPGARHREAYAWGNLTSGGRMAALWLLLLPFSLANLSYFMLPRPEGGRRLRHAAEAAQRLLALLLTGTLVGALTTAGVDLVGWQCAQAGRACSGDAAPVWVRWLGDLWGSRTSPRLAVTALVPLGVLALLWWLARRTWERDERTVLPPGGAARPGVLLARPRLWHGGEPVWRLRAVHVSFAAGSVGLAVAAPYTGDPTGRALVLANAGVQIAAAVLAALPGIARRTDPYADEPSSPGLTGACAALRAAAPLVVLVTLVAAFDGLREPPYAPTLPGVGAGTFQTALALGLLAFLLVAVAVLAGRDRREGGGEQPRALGGMAAWFVLVIAAGVGNALALGVLFWTAAFFGTPAPSRPAPSHPAPFGRVLLIDEPLWWAAALVPLLAAGTLVAAVLLWGIRGRAAAELAPRLRPYYGEGDAPAVADTWALASLTDRAGLVLGVLTGVGLAGLGAVTVVSQLRLFTPDGGVAGLLATGGSWAMTAVVVGLVLLGRRTYGDPRLRRTVGIVWDVSTFWPRAIHPLSPPCYTERVVPELIARVGALARNDGDEVIVSGHSQGSVIAAALTLQLDPALLRRTRLLTHGSPLRRLYAAFFPAYFGPSTLHAVRESVSWLNLYRLSDPIGGPVFRRADPFAPGVHGDGDGDGDGETVDRFCWDPLQPGPGEPLPSARWHSDYWLDPAYEEALSRLTVLGPAHPAPADG